MQAYMFHAIIHAHTCVMQGLMCHASIHVSCKHTFSISTCTHTYFMHAHADCCAAIWDRSGRPFGMALSMLLMVTCWYFLLACSNGSHRLSCNCARRSFRLPAPQWLQHRYQQHNINAELKGAKLSAEIVGLVECSWSNPGHLTVAFEGRGRGLALVLPASK